MDAWYKELIQTFQVLFPARAITAAHGWTYKILTESTYPRLMSFPRDRAEDLLRVEAGQAIANAMLAATDLGLGCCLIATGRKPAEFPKVLGTPENIVPIWLMAVGYPAEDPGQRPRKRFDRLYHYNQYGTPLAEDQDVRAELEQQKLIQPMDPLPGREESFATYAGCSVSQKTCRICRRRKSSRCTRRSLPITENSPRVLRKGESEKRRIYNNKEKGAAACGVFPEVPRFFSAFTFSARTCRDSALCAPPRFLCPRDLLSRPREAWPGTCRLPSRRLLSRLRDTRLCRSQG